MRRILPFATGVIFFSLLIGSPLRAGQDSGLDLLHKMQRALGGANRIEAIRDLDWTVRANTFDHAGKAIGQVTKRTRWIRPNYLRLDQVGPGDTYVLYFDGVSGWEVPPGSTRAIGLEGQELQFARGYLNTFMLNIWVADRAGSWLITSPAPNVIRLSSSANRADSYEIKLDPATWLPADPNPRVMEWQEVAGSFPAHEVNSHPDDGSADIWTEKIVSNSGLKPEALRATPPDGRPVLVNH
ncbi:MAG: hypothetical protein JO300_00265 [Silvibacterium sp.]|nr:hypothetical protein [Silvibacterium sp.]